MKKIQDFYFKKAKKEGYPARSVYKLEEAQKKHNFLKRGGRALDLGCHPGSWSMYLAKALGPAGLVVGVDLQEGKGLHVTGGAKIKIYAADIMDDATLAIIRETCQNFTAVVSDMAPGTTGNKWADQQQSLNLARRALEIAGAMLQPGGAFYCKVFEGEDFREYVEEVRKFFGQVKVVKPLSSRKESREVFVLGLAFRGNMLPGATADALADIK
ncbi:MAG: RlmE family RNA methyltransferase [Desulfobulbaceae bacterium]|nr:RlmE family RNA methyltransferase [Desulfobulbaceae bacterium]